MSVRTRVCVQHTSPPAVTLLSTCLDFSPFVLHMNEVYVACVPTCTILLLFAELKFAVLYVWCMCVCVYACKCTSYSGGLGGH